MLIPTLEVLAVSFVLGVLITAIVLGSLWSVETVTRLCRQRDVPSVDELPLRAVGLLRRHREPGRSRAA